jgi:hypothetical protein
MKQFSQDNLVAIGASVALALMCLVGLPQSPDLIWGALFFGRPRRRQAATATRSCSYDVVPPSKGGGCTQRARLYYDHPVM